MLQSTFIEKFSTKKVKKNNGELPQYYVITVPMEITASPQVVSMSIKAKLLIFVSLTVSNCVIIAVGHYLYLYEFNQDKRLLAIISQVPN